jgi:hypothetical protein
VDDCDSKETVWDGSDQAYKEFMQEINQPVQIVHGKLGIVGEYPLVVVNPREVSVGMDSDPVSLGSFILLIVTEAVGSGFFISKV